MSCISHKLLPDPSLGLLFFCLKSNNASYYAITQVEVTYTDGTLARGVPVKLLKGSTQLGSFPSDEDGKAIFQINTNANEKTLDLTVTSRNSNLFYSSIDIKPMNRQDSAETIST